MALREWLPLMFRGVESFVSSEDIEKGARWSSELDKELDGTDFGLLCITPENLEAPWIMYEAGALAKSLEHGSAATLLLGLTKAQLKYPLARFQATDLDPDDFFRLVRTINGRFGVERHKEPDLQTLFDALWPKLHAKLDAAKQTDVDAPDPQRSERDMLEELMATVRRLSSVFDDVAQQIGSNNAVVEWVDEDNRSTTSPALRPWIRDDLGVVEGRPVAPDKTD
jgi:hypothetical protein